jgi:adenosylcobinamide kinase / adenosylcobinamide-phosphate guanylyltransferase
MTMHELLLGGQKSGKSRTAELRAAAWLAQGRDCEALLLATALAGDDEMRARIERHRQDRALRVPAMSTQEVGADLGAALRQHGAPQRLIVIDCLTLWLTQLRLPLHGPAPAADDEAAHIDTLCAALAAAPGPVVLVSNEIGLGVMPLGSETRAFLDALGLLHQRIAALCPRVTLMVAGLELPLKRAA